MLQNLNRLPVFLKEKLIIYEINNRTKNKLKQQKEINIQQKLSYFKNFKALLNQFIMIMNSIILN